jgi:hypothetical protein
MFAPSETADLESVLSTLDGLLIAMTEECEAEEITPDTFQGLLCRSLVHLQVATPDHRQTVNRLFAARVSYIRGRFPDQAQRRRFYQLGLPLRDCESIEAQRDELLAIYLEAAVYATWTVRQRAGHLADIAGRLFLLSEIAPSVEVPGCWRRILELWLGGRTPTAILADPEVAAEKLSAHSLNRWMDEAFGYRLPWGFNSLAVYLKQYSEVTNNQWPAVCDYYSSFVKYGVHEPAACWLLAVGVPSRATAARVGRLIGGRADSPESLLRWLRSDGIEKFLAEGLSNADAQMLQAAVSRDGGLQAGRSKGLTLTLNRKDISDPVPDPGTRVLVEPVPGGASDEYRLLTLSGKLIRRFRVVSDHLASLMANPEFATAEVVSPDQTNDATKLHIRIEAI